MTLTALRNAYGLDGGSTAATGLHPLTTYSGTPAYGAGIAGQALTAGALSTPVAAGFTAWTVEGWVKTTASGSIRAIFGLSNGALLGILPDGKLYFKTTGGGFNDGNGTQTVNDGVWHHVAYVADGSSNAIYLDGIRQKEIGNSSVAFTSLIVGAADQAGYDWSGSIDEVRVSSTARYTGNSTAPTAPLAVDASTWGLWRLNGNGSDEVPTAGGNVKVWNGTAWVAKPVKIWNGTAWIAKPVKVWDGTTWKTTTY